MAQPDPDFAAFFEGEWQELLIFTEIPGMDDPSWDRRAAYLLWCMASHYVADTETGYAWPDVLMGLVTPSKPLSEVLMVHREDTTKFPYAPHPEAAPIVGKVCNCHQPGLGGDCDGSCQHVNPVEDDNCAPQPGGVSLAFDSSKWSGEND